MPRHPDHNDISGIRPLMGAISEGRPREAFTRLLERVLGANDGAGTGSVPAAVLAHENNPGRLPETNDIDGPRGTNFSCVAVPRFIFVLGGTYRVVRNLDDRSQDRIVRNGEFYWIHSGGWNLIRNDATRTVLSVIFEQCHIRFLWYHHKREPVPGAVRIRRAHTELRYRTHAPAGAGLQHAVALMGAAVAAGQEPACDTGTLRSTARTLLAWCLHELRTDAALATAANTSGTLAPGRRTFDEICAYVAEHLQGDLSREQVVGVFRISEDHLTRLFRIHAQCGFVEFVRGERFRLAERLLATSRLSVKEVAAACGFNLSEYFIKRFREQHGVTPMVWRRRGQEAWSSEAATKAGDPTANGRE
ncbi:MAG: AraC family transcriptional regulator [Opitutaceae bacterium]|jgi:AraC-like DNA-binding protein|nr:AraC family transcriptional regulator [Opitutaceae bacterium]